MKNSAVKILGVAGIAAVLGLSGCATNKKVDELTQRVAEVEATANSASAAAKSAQDDAAAAIGIAEAAKQTADDSASCCIGTNEKIDRMFDKAQRK